MFKDNDSETGFYLQSYREWLFTIDKQNDFDEALIFFGACNRTRSLIA